MTEVQLTISESKLAGFEFELSIPKFAISLKFQSLTRVVRELNRLTSQRY